MSRTTTNPTYIFGWILLTNECSILDSGFKTSDWVVVDDKFKDETISNTSKESIKTEDLNRQSKYSAPSSSASSSTDASKRFANAKSISSQQYFGNDKIEV